MILRHSVPGQGRPSPDAALYIFVEQVSRQRYVNNLRANRFAPQTADKLAEIFIPIGRHIIQLVFTTQHLATVTR